MLILDENRLIEDEYEKEYFGFSSTELILSVAEAIEGIINEEVTKVHNLYSKDNVDNNVDQKKELQDLYLNAAKNSLEVFEVAARKIFKIPESMKPEIDKNDVSDEDIRKLTKEIEDMKKEYFEDCKYFDVLKKKQIEVEQLSGLIDLVQTVLPSAQKPDSIVKFKKWMVMRDELEASLTKDDNIYISEFLDKCKPKEPIN